MQTIGLTGSIGAGKSTVLGLFANIGVASFDVDHAVHDLYRDRASEAVSARFPEAVVEGVVERKRLSALVIGDDRAMDDLEAIVFPLIWGRLATFLEKNERQATPMVVVDIPLLFERECDGDFSSIIVVTAPGQLCAERVLRRPGMTIAKLSWLNSRQLAEHKKVARAHFTIDNSGDLAATKQQARDILVCLAGLYRQSTYKFQQRACTAKEGK